MDRKQRNSVKTIGRILAQLTRIHYGTGFPMIAGERNLSLSQTACDSDLHGRCEGLPGNATIKAVTTDTIEEIGIELAQCSMHLSRISNRPQEPYRT